MWLADQVLCRDEARWRLVLSIIGENSDSRTRGTHMDTKVARQVKRLVDWRKVSKKLFEADKLAKGTCIMRTVSSAYCTSPRWR